MRNWRRVVEESGAGSNDSWYEQCVKFMGGFEFTTNRDMSNEVMHLYVYVFLNRLPVLRALGLACLSQPSKKLRSSC